MCEWCSLFLAKSLIYYHNFLDGKPLEKWTSSNGYVRKIISLDNAIDLSIHRSICLSAFIFQYIYLSIQLQGFQEKLCFFTIHSNQSLAYILLQDAFKVLNAMWVHRHSYWLVRERCQNLKHSWKKNNFFCILSFI